MKGISILNSCIVDSTVQPELRKTGRIHRVSTLATYGTTWKAWIIDALILTPDVLLDATWSLGHLIDSGDFDMQLRFWGLPQSNTYELITNMNSLYYLEGWGNKPIKILFIKAPTMCCCCYIASVVSDSVRPHRPAHQLSPISLFKIRRKHIDTRHLVERE